MKKPIFDVQAGILNTDQQQIARYINGLTLLNLERRSISQHQGQALRNNHKYKVNLGDGGKVRGCHPMTETIRGLSETSPQI